MDATAAAPRPPLTQGRREPGAGETTTPRTTHANGRPGWGLQRGLENRIRAIGRDIFEHADAARPRVWQRAWWLFAVGCAGSMGCELGLRVRCCVRARRLRA